MGSKTIYNRILFIIENILCIPFIKGLVINVKNVTNEHNNV